MLFDTESLVEVLTDVLALALSDTLFEVESLAEALTD